jgi:hypothetical protein
MFFLLFPNFYAESCNLVYLIVNLAWDNIKMSQKRSADNVDCDDSQAKKPKQSVNRDVG